MTVNTNTYRANRVCDADDVKASTPTAWMISFAPPLDDPSTDSLANLVLRPGQFKRAIPGHSSQAPKAPIGTLIGGVGAPILFGELISTGSTSMVSWGYIAGAVLMILGSVAEWAFGVEAAGKSLESISEPLQSKRETGSGA